jgi:hypothetical protein
VSGQQIPRRWPEVIRGICIRIPLFVTLETFWRLLGAIYFIAFCSLGVQASGLLGSRGILPYADFLRVAREAIGPSAYWRVPSVLWLHPTDVALSACWISGAISAATAMFRIRQRTALAVCLVLWLSLCSVGQDFLSFQWDILLCEAGFLAIFAGRSRVRIWLFRWLLFRLMFFSGVVKLASGDAAWRNLTALHYHYETQPLPTPLAWYLHQLPIAFHKASTLLTFFVELLVPFWFFLPRPLRHVGGYLTIALQVLILLSGNYTYFNFLTIALAMFLFVEPSDAPVSRASRVVTIALAAFIGLLSGMQCLRLFDVPLPPGGAAVMHLAAPFELVNSYGLFAVMTTERNEIVVEGSDDGVEWRAYEFRYKPGDLRRAPPIVAPFQPRLDWQMWFAALGDVQQNRWFVNFVVRLLQGEPAVLSLLQSNPFPQSPPKFVRARLYQYHFTHFGEPGWWKREEKRDYLPPALVGQALRPAK